MNIEYLWSKIVKKMRGSAIKNSTVDKTSKIDVYRTLIDFKYLEKKWNKQEEQ
jgi:hypothetical protein